MSHDHNQQSDSLQTTDQPPATASDHDEVEWLSAAESEERPSLVDPLLYAPLVLVGTALVVFPEPATTAIGLVCLLGGISLAFADVRSSTA